MAYKFCWISTACNNEDEAVKIASLLLDEGLVSSCHINEIRSLYIWNGERVDEKEFELTVLARSDYFKEIEKIIKKNHSYDLCQITAVPISKVSSEFALWADAEKLEDIEYL